MWFYNRQKLLLLAVENADGNGGKGGVGEQECALTVIAPLVCAHVRRDHACSTDLTSGRKSARNFECHA